MVEIKSVIPGSLADKKGIKGGETLLTVDSHEIADILDYRFYICEKKIKLSLKDRSGHIREVEIKKDEYEDIGLEFETYLMDEKTSCTNKCIFCFIDQNPHSMREGIYFKDDDTRLSFLFGNYVTLTNVKDEELSRLVKMHISPINISVQTTNPKLREMMLSNRFAGKILDQMKILADGGLDINAQIVLCPDVNDKSELDRTIRDLEKFYPNLKSVSVVPVGLTKHRKGLYPLRPFTKEEAREVIGQVENYGREFYEKYGTRIVFLADEFYIKADMPLPKPEFYEGYPQLENGVGMISSFVDDALFCLEDEEKNGTPRRVSIATGVASYPTVLKIVEKIKEKWYNIECSVYEVKNEFYGENVTVSGLLTGRDIINALKGKELHDLLLIPRNALRHEGDRFLDDVTVSQMEEELHVRIVATDGGEDFVFGVTRA